MQSEKKNHVQRSSVCVCVCVLIMECYPPATLCGYTSRKTSCIYQMNLHGCKFSVRQLKKF